MSETTSLIWPLLIVLAFLMGRAWEAVRHWRRWRQMEHEIEQWAEGELRKGPPPAA